MIFHYTLAYANETKAELEKKIYTLIEAAATCTSDDDCRDIPRQEEKRIASDGKEVLVPNYTIGCMSSVNKTTDITVLLKNIQLYYETYGSWHCGYTKAKCIKKLCTTGAGH
jgi:hypothetical protein